MIEPAGHEDDRREAGRAPVVVGSLRVDPDGYTARLDGHDLALTLKEFELLLALARSAGSFVLRSRLMAEVWGEIRRPTRTLDIHIRRLRSKFGDRAGAIQTRVRVGYRLSPSELAEEPAGVTRA